MKKFYAYDINGKVVLSTIYGESDRVCAFDNIDIEEGDVAGAVRQLKEHGYTVDASEIVFEYDDDEEETSNECECSVCSRYNGKGVKEKRGKVGGIKRVRA